MSCRERRLVDAHFAGRIDPEDERRLRLHLESCEACRARYERQQMLGAVDPRALSLEERIGRGLGLRRRRRALVWPVVALTAAVAAALLLIFWPGLTGHEDELGVRGGGGGRAPMVRLVAYRLVEGKRASYLGESIAPRDELAFAYVNRAGKRYLMVFGVDNRQKVYWYHPAWEDEATSPRAVPIRPGADLRELPHAVSHDLAGDSLTLCGVFLDRPLTVKEVERLLRKHPPGRLPLPGALQTTKRVRIRR